MPLGAEVGAAGEAAEEEAGAVEEAAGLMIPDRGVSAVAPAGAACSLSLPVQSAQGCIASAGVIGRTWTVSLSQFQASVLTVH